MLVKVELFGELDKYVRNGSKKFDVELADGSTVADLAADIGFTNEDAWSVAVDGTVLYPPDELSDGAVAIVFPPIAGG